MSDEKWRWVVGYEGLYMVSDMGQVMSVPGKAKHGKILKQRENPKGKKYMSVCLSKGNEKKDVSVHRLVAKAFLPNYDRKPEVNHKNGNRQDNRAENLEWVTRSENQRHAYKSLGKQPTKYWEGKPRLFARKLTEDQVRSIKSDNRPSSEIAREYDVSKTTIQNIKKGKVYKDVI